MIELTLKQNEVNYLIKILEKQGNFPIPNAIKVKIKEAQNNYEYIND